MKELELTGAIGVGAALRRELLRRHYAAFDWQYGGPPGPLKYVDVHQLEFAGRLARAGDGRARIMLQRYVRGIERLVMRPDSGAAHYATGPAWNRPCLARTLAGQAVAIQALVIAGRLHRSCAHVRVVSDLAAFVAARWIGVAGGAIRKARSCGPARAGELAWYVSALRAFAELYDNAGLRAAAHRDFERIADLLHAMRRDSSHMLPVLTLGERVAIATVTGEFSETGGDAGLAHFARRILIAGARRQVHPAGAWTESYRDGAPPDLDCSIDLVRAATTLRNRAQPELARIAAAGKRALLKPEFALARAPESGLLLLSAGPCADSAPHGTGIPLRGHESRLRRASEKPLVNVRK